MKSNIHPLFEKIFASHGIAPSSNAPTIDPESPLYLWLTDPKAAPMSLSSNQRRW